MEGTVALMVENLYYQKIMLYNDLLHCLNEERASLIRIDLDKLWQVSREKEEICERIRTARQEIIVAAFPEENHKAFDFNRFMAQIDRESKNKFQNLNLKLIKLKSEVEIARKENMTYINDSLLFLDEMISIITGADQSKIIYNDKCHYRKSRPDFYLSREV
ncbi:MAG: flagellar protein FlgN [Proteobacteria bacterium]|nr:flagellar protein FlgN [Pseudomonadota bacterium]